MKNYHVILTSLVNPCRDLPTDNEPQTKEYHYDVTADDKKQARTKAGEMHDLPVWESEVYEDL